MVDFDGYISDDIDYYYDKEDTECKIITMESMVSMVLATTPSDTHDLTKNQPHCVDPNNIKPGMDYFLGKAHYDNTGKWIITFN